MFRTKRYVADLHLNHEAIIRLCNRPFLDIEEMTREIIRRWNAVVQPHDITYILGDYGSKPKSMEMRDYHAVFNALHGEKHLIIGNHDQDRDGDLRPEIAKLGWASPPRDIVRLNDGGRQLCLCHYSINGWPNRHHGAVHFFGHAHGREQGVGLSRDVGVDLPDVDFTPRTFQELTQGWSFERRVKG